MTHRMKRYGTGTWDAAIWPPPSACSLREMFLRSEQNSHAPAYASIVWNVPGD